MPSMTRDDMDQWASGGCHKDGCGHDDHTMFLHSSCHINVPSFTVEAVDRVAVACCKCGQPICILEASKIEKTQGKCCNEGGDDIGWGSYTVGSGIVTFACYYCKKEIMKVTLK